MPTISVIIPTYNCGRFVTDAIESALAQSHKPSEIIVVDDGSTDETERVVKRFGDAVHYIRQENAGVCAARNRGVAESSGDLIAFFDADDTWQTTKLEKQAALFETDPEVGLVHCGMREFDSDTGKTITSHLEGQDGWVAEEIALWERPVVNVSGSVVMVTRKAFDEVGGFDTRLKNGEDWEFCIRVAKRYKIGFVREALVNYRNHGKNATKNIREMERSTLIAWDKVFGTGDESFRKLRRRSYGNLHKVLAGSYLQAGDYGGVIRNVIKSLWYRPSYLAYYLAPPLRRKNKG